MDSSEKAELIRRGNEAFNRRDIQKARELFLKADYKAGLERLGDYIMYERSLPLLAYGYYKQAGASTKIEDIHRRMVGALSEWLGRDKLKDESRAMLSGGKRSSLAGIKADADGMIPVPVNDALKNAALNILDKKIS